MVVHPALFDAGSDSHPFEDVVLELKYTRRRDALCGLRQKVNKLALCDVRAQYLLAACLAAL